MKAGVELKYPAAKFLIPTIALLVTLAARPSAAANDAIELLKNFPVSYSVPFARMISGHALGVSAVMPSSVPKISSLSP